MRVSGDNWRRQKQAEGEGETERVNARGPGGTDGKKELAGPPRVVKETVSEDM